MFTSSPCACAPRARHLLSAGASAIVLAIAVLLLAGCGGSEGEQTEAGYAIGEPVKDSTIAAIVEAKGFSDTLSYERLQSEMNQLARGRLQMFPDSVKQQVQRAALMRFIDFTAQIAEAQERELGADSAAAVQQRMKQLKARVGGDSLLRARLAQSGMTMPEVRANIRSQLQVLGLQQALADEVEDPTAEEVSTYRTDQAREVRVKRILFQVPPQATPSQRDSVKQRARTVLDSIQNGTASFAAMAKRYGQGDGGGGGPATYQSREGMAAPFAQRGQSPEDVPFVQAAFALQDSGAVASEPVQTSSGYYLLKQTGSRTGTLMDSARAVQGLTRQQQQQAVTQAVEELRNNATLHLNPSRVTADMTKPLPNQGGEESEGA